MRLERRLPRLTDGAPASSPPTLLYYNPGSPSPAPPQGDVVPAPAGLPLPATRFHRSRELRHQGDGEAGGPAPAGLPL